ncbi:hypothetical protein ACPPVS_01515 [Cellulomonas sp. McL0617]|uniref:hypothetical protein n=1 Tax=Cellulomonas sp. McL0617 TaxID=3415675 RepID=UPI003CF6A9A3
MAQEPDAGTLDPEAYDRRRSTLRWAFGSVAGLCLIGLGLLWWLLGPFVALLAAVWGGLVLAIYYRSATRRAERLSVRPPVSEWSAVPAALGAATSQTTLAAASAMTDLDVRRVRAARTQGGDRAAMTEIHHQRPALSPVVVAEMLRML